MKNEKLVIDPLTGMLPEIINELNLLTPDQLAGLEHGKRIEQILKEFENSNLTKGLAVVYSICLKRGKTELAQLLRSEFETEVNFNGKDFFVENHIQDNE